LLATPLIYASPLLNFRHAAMLPYRSRRQRRAQRAAHMRRAHARFGMRQRRSMAHALRASFTQLRAALH